MRAALRYLLFMQADPLIQKSRSATLEASDLNDIPDPCSSSAIANAFLKLKAQSPFELIYQVFLIERAAIFVAALLGLGYALSHLSTPLLIYRLVDFVHRTAEGQVSLGTGVGAGLLLCLFSSLTGLLQHHYIHLCLRFMIAIIKGLNLRIFDEALHLSRFGRQRYGIGDIVNLINLDAESLGRGFFDAIELGLKILMVSGAAWMLWTFLGLAGLGGLMILIGIAPLTRALVRRFTRLDEELMGHRDERVSLVSQLLSGIRLVKYFAWERRVLAEVQAIRRKEIKARWRLFRNSGLASLVYAGGSLLVGLISFSLASYLGVKLDAARIFSCLMIFSMLDGLVGSMTDLISSLSTAKVGAARIAAFIAGTHRHSFSQLSASPAAPPLGLQLSSGEFKYEDDKSPVLANVQLEIEAGEAVAIVGAVGSGKSTLLLALLGQIPQTRGELQWKGLKPGSEPRFAYVPQEASVIHGSLCDNLSFGARADMSDRLDLDLVLEACCLKHDIQRFPGGLEAEIGEQGINLSGGQKQRLSLARAALRDPSLVLLDDPLSALDSGTEAMLVDRLLFGLWRQKTRLVVTHRLAHLGRFDRVIYIEQGRIVANGSLAELLARHEPFRNFYNQAQREDSQGESSTNAAEAEPSGRQEEPMPKSAEAPETAQSDNSASYAALVQAEDRAIGSVKGELYWRYLGALLQNHRGKVWPYALLFLTAAVLTIGLPMLQNNWLAYWTDHQRVGFVGLQHWPSVLYRFEGALAIWGFLGLLGLLAAVSHQLLWLKRALSAGVRIHDQALGALLRAPLRFFDSTPSGRILNRFSRDVESAERDVAWNLEKTLVPVFHALAALLLLLVKLPSLLIVIGPALLVYHGFQRKYRRAMLDVQRLTSLARSPRFAYLKETMQAVSTIQAHRDMSSFFQRYQLILDRHQKAFYGSILLNRWFSSRVPILGGFIAFGLVTTILLLARSGQIAPGLVGLLLVYATKLSDHLNNAIRSFTSIESSMIGIERLQHFQTLEAEEDLSRPKPLPSAWPHEASIVFEGVQARYAPQLPTILKDCSFAVQAGQKAGIIGRTGAGKSTIFQLLFRFIEPSEGRILIGGHDIRTLPLEGLRRSIAIIPQDPMLFKGSLRSNLDRFEQYSDAEIWEALRRAHLKAWVAKQPLGLLTPVAENGHNFSQGQRQLVCLARALLLDTKIVVMDEATASVDAGTDALIQTTIREECRDKTVLIIAHRLETLSLCDLVIEMAEGRALMLERSPCAQSSQVFAAGNRLLENS